MKCDFCEHEATSKLYFFTTERGHTQLRHTAIVCDACVYYRQQRAQSLRLRTAIVKL